MRLLILAGGLGTRLKEAVSHVPKALAPIADVPFLRYQIENWISQGLREFTFLLHHQSAPIITFIKAQQGDLLRDSRVDWLIEPIAMDTGGSIAHAVKKLNLRGDFLITNADTWLGGGIREIMLCTSPAISVVNLNDVSRYGEVFFNEDRHVIGFHEKNGQSSAGWINAGLCRLTADLFKNWDGKPFSLERGLLTSLVQDCRLTAVPLKTDFIDIGVPEDYYRFCQWMASGRVAAL